MVVLKENKIFLLTKINILNDDSEILSTNILIILLQPTVTSSYKKTIASDYLEDTRAIKINLPKGYDKDEEKNYPTAVVLDAKYVFDLYVGNAVLFAAKEKAPKQIIVGINMEKTRKKDTYFDTENGTLTANNQMCYKFIKNEVFFEIESNFKTSPFISIIGEGTSANLITSFLAEPIPFINSYICINPTFSDLIGQQIQSYNLMRFQ